MAAKEGTMIEAIRDLKLGESFVRVRRHDFSRGPLRKGDMNKMLTTLRNGMQPTVARASAATGNTYTVETVVAHTRAHVPLALLIVTHVAEAEHGL